MPIAKIDNKGNELFFTDSGAVPGSDNYTTLIIYHGTAFTGNTFHKLLPLGAAHNIRIVILNRKDYAGSTKYTDIELKDLHAGRKSFMERIGLSVANFLIWFQETYNIPKISTDRKCGGLAVMGWSLGTATVLALLGHSDVIPRESYTKLAPYLRKIIIYDSPHLAFGYPQPEECYNPFTDPTFKSPDEAVNNFSYWASSYYNHPSLSSRSPSGLDFSTRPQNPVHPPSIDNMTPEEMLANFDRVAAERTEFAMLLDPMQSTLRIQAEQALFSEETAASILKDLEVVWLACERSCWICLWGWFETERIYKEHVEKGKKVRPINFIEIPGANHFLHWDDPESFLGATSQSIN